MLKDGALEDMLSQPFLMEILFRYVSNERETEVIKTALLIGKDLSLLDTYKERVAPWLKSKNPNDRLESILMSDIVQNTTLSFTPSESVKESMRRI